MNTQTLKLTQIRIDGGTQPRVEIDQEVVADYAEQMRDGVEFPPVTVFFDGAAYWLADGFHRYHSHRQVGRDTIVADIHDGGLREAIIYSVGANREHGLRRTNEDKRKAVETMLTNDLVSKDEDGNPWSNRDVARLCFVGEATVRKYREILTARNAQLENSEKVAYITKHGSKAVMNTAKIGKSTPKRRKQYGGIAPDAFKPIRSCGQYEAKAALELPYKPVYAAKTIISVMGAELAVEIAEEILQIAKGN